MNKLVDGIVLGGAVLSEVCKEGMRVVNEERWNEASALLNCMNKAAAAGQIHSWLVSVIFEGNTCFELQSYLYVGHD